MITFPWLRRMRLHMWPSVFSADRGQQRLVEQILDRARRLRPSSDAELRTRTEPLRVSAASGECESATTVEAFALLHEAIRRVIGLEVYDVQLLAGFVLASGAVAEMQTGEGKTLAAAFPAFWQGLTGHGTHVATTNSYLARRDYELLGPVFRLLGVSAGLIEEQMPVEAKRAAYACDITYGTGYEFGFDYLRDQVALLAAQSQRLGQRYRARLRGQESGGPRRLQRGHASAIIDEVDSVLIDEACLPLILSDDVAEPSGDLVAYCQAKQLADDLVAGRDFEVRETDRALRLTATGHACILACLDGNLQRALCRPWSAYVEQALHAKHLLKRDVDYVVKGGTVQLVDEFTGRILPDRQWRDGLHQAVEVKEGLSKSPQRTTSARISRQRYFRLYQHICGMTGTAAGGERELWRIYRLPVVVIPLRKPSQRTAWPTMCFIDAASKWAAVVCEIETLHRAGRPVLVGSRTIENSELLARRLAAAGIPYRLLNGKQDADEAAIVAQAGQRGTVTLATNMAGRGTDIKLGPGVAELGGLHVVGVERHESLRIDRQLAGRAGRQGDPGSCRFFVSADDPLLGRFASGLQRRMRTMAHESGRILVDLSAPIAAAQRRADAAGFVHRRRLFAYDRWLDELLAALLKSS